MEENLKDLNTALKLISTLQVSGDAVDYVAVAKNSIRNVIKRLSEEAQSDGVTNT